MTANRAGRRAISTRKRLEGEVRELRVANENLLDLLNALLGQHGGKVVIPSIEIEGQSRRRVVVTILPPKDGAPARHVIELEGYQEEHPRGILARLGLAAPGR